WSPNAAAIAPLTAEAKKPFVIMNAAGAGIVRISPYVARISFTLWQSRYPLASPDLAPFFQRVKDAKPDALYSFVPGGPQSTNVVKTWRQLGLADAGIKLIGPMDIVIENELPNM